MAANHILFVCSGNICRSPMAEYLLRAALPRESGWIVESAGTSAIAGLPASPEAIDVLAEQGLDLVPHRSRPVTAEGVRRARVIVAMTRMHRDLLQDLDANAGPKTFLLLSFGPNGMARELDDPIGGSMRVYRACRDTIASCLPDLRDYLTGLP